MVSVTASPVTLRRREPDPGEWRPLVVGCGGGGSKLILQCMRSPKYVPCDDAHYPGEWFLADTDPAMFGELLANQKAPWHWREDILRSHWIAIPTSSLDSSSPRLQAAVGGVGGNTGAARVWAQDYLEKHAMEPGQLYYRITDELLVRAGMILAHAFGRGSGAGMAEPVWNFLYQSVMKGSSNLNLDLAILGDHRIPDENVYPLAPIHSLHYLLKSSVVHSVLLVDNGHIADHTKGDRTYNGMNTSGRINAFLHEALLPLWVNLRHPDFSVSGFWRKNIDIADVRQALLQYPDVTKPSQPTLSALGFARLSVGNELASRKLDPETGFRKLMEEALSTLSIEVERNSVGRIVASSFYAFLTGPPWVFDRYLGSRSDAIATMDAGLLAKLWTPDSEVRGELGVLQFPKARHVRLTVLLSGINPVPLQIIAKRANLEVDQNSFSSIAEVIRALDETWFQNLGTSNQKNT